MVNPSNTNQTTESDSGSWTRRARRARRARRSQIQIYRWSDDMDERQARLITIQVIILSFVITVVFLTPILVSCYVTLYSFVTHLELFYKLFMEPIIPNFPPPKLTSVCVSFLHTLFVIDLVLFIFVMWGATYICIQAIIELIYNGEIFL